MSHGQDHPDGAKQLAQLMITWKQPCCGCPGGGDAHSRFEEPSPWPKSLKDFNVDTEIKLFIDTCNGKMRETEVPVCPLLSPFGMICCCGFCIFINKMKDREAFLEDQIKDFNEKIAHFKGLELRWNEGKRAYDRARGGPGVQVNASYNTGGGGRKRRNRQPQIDIRQFDVGLDLVKLPNEDKETLEETVNQPVIEIQPQPQPPGLVDE